MTQAVTFSEMEEGQQEGIEHPPMPSEEGTPAPETPSQEAPPETPPEELIPEEDERGVPAQNVLGEMRKKYTRVYDENQALKARLDALEQRINSPAVDQQPKPVISKSDAEVLQQIRNEADQKVQLGEITDTGAYWKYCEDRKLELMPQPDINQAIQQHVRTLTTRSASEQKAINEYPDLQTYNSILSQAVLREIQARERRNPKFREQNPYYLEEITPRIATQLNIRPKSWNGGAQARNKMSPPMADAGLRSSAQRSEIVSPSEYDRHVSGFFKHDPVEIAKQKKAQPNQKEFIFPEV